MKNKLNFLITALLFAFVVNAQNVISVDNSSGVTENPPYIYNALQDAIDAASSGDTIYVQASGINYGDVTINKELTLIGFGHSHSEKNSYVDTITLQDNSSGCKFSGLYVTDRFVTQNPNIKITNLVFENNRIGVINIDDFYGSYPGADNLLVRGNIIGTISGYFTNTIIANNVITYLIYIGNNYQSVTIKNNIFYRGSSGSGKAITNSANSSGSIIAQNCIFYYNSTYTDGNPNSDGVIFENCLSYNRGAGSVTTLSGSNNLDNQDPLFTEDNNNDDFDSTDDYHLQTGSPAIGAGAGGVDIGIYDSDSFAFNNEGYTNGIPAVKITNITDRVAVGTDLSVTISTNAN